MFVGMARRSLLGAPLRCQLLHRLARVSLLVGSCLLLLVLLTSRQLQQLHGRQRPDLQQLLRTQSPKRTGRPPGPVQYNLRRPSPKLQSLTLADVMISRYGSADLELVRSGQLERPASCPARVIVSWAGGRSGNLLFEYMAAWALAEWNNATLLIPDHMVEAFEGVFPHMSGQRGDLDLLMMECGRQWSARLQLELNKIEDAWLDFPASGWIQLLGFPINITAAVAQQVHARADRLRHELRFSDGIVGVVQAYLRRVRDALAPISADVTFVGVHARLTDLFPALYNLFGLTLTPPSKTYFLQGMHHFRSRYSNVVFVVVSDDMAWCREHLTGLDDAVLFPGGDHAPFLDMALLAACNHSIITYSTFAMSAALMNGGEMVIPTDPQWTDGVWSTQRQFWTGAWTEIPIT